MSRTVKPDDEQMCCVLCGLILPIAEGYKTEYPDGKDGDAFPICPKCGEWNVGGCSSFEAWMMWSEDGKEMILDAGKQETPSTARR